MSTNIIMEEFWPWLCKNEIYTFLTVPFNQYLIEILISTGAALIYYLGTAYYFAVDTL